MTFNETEIGLLLFYLTGGVIVLIIAIIALPTILRDKIEEAAKKLNTERSGTRQASV